MGKIRIHQWLQPMVPQRFCMMDEPRIKQMGTDFQIFVVLIRAIGVIRGFRPV